MTIYYIPNINTKNYECRKIYPISRPNILVKRNICRPSKRCFFQLRTSMNSILNLKAQKSLKEWWSQTVFSRSVCSGLTTMEKCRPILVIGCNSIMPSVRIRRYPFPRFCKLVNSQILGLRADVQECVDHSSYGWRQGRF